MGLSKAALFTQEQNELASLAKALAHPARVAILQHLIRANACINGDLVQETGLAQATVSQHLRELKAAGLIKGSIEGASVCYCIDPLRWQQTRSILASLLDSYVSPPENECC